MAGSLLSGRSFARNFANERLRRLYPSARVEVGLGTDGNYSRVSVTIDDRDLMALDRDELARELNRKLTPTLARRRHWSLFRSKR